MTKPVKSQWDFGELFPMQPTRKVLSVSELTSQVRRLLEQQVGLIWVSGEVSNLKVQSSGHCYFSLKDAGAQLNCVLFRGELQVDRTILQDGRKVTLQGNLTVYETRGQYQLIVIKVEAQGIGALQVAFEKLKQKLNAEGLFAQARKRTLPKYPQRIGLVTSPTGAAIRDVLHVVERRNPSLEIILAPCRVQGAGAAVEVASAIRLLNEFNKRASAKHLPEASARTADFFARADRRKLKLDLILLTRGGGSLEDLWAFNEEIVARAVFHSDLPVVSAVGHEIDFTISDFVADLRAATPSAAAEIITEGVFASCQFLADARPRILQLARAQLQDKRLIRDQLMNRLGRMHPRRRLEDRLQRLDELQAGLLRLTLQRYKNLRITWRNFAERLSRVRPALILRQRRLLLDQTSDRLRQQTNQRFRDCRHKFLTLEDRLRLLGPEGVLARGYSITTDAETGKVIRSPAGLKPGQRLKSRLNEGEVTSRVEE